MRWTSEKLETAKRILSSCNSIDEAITEIGQELKDASVTKEALRRAFSRNGIASPDSLLDRTIPVFNLKAAKTATLSLGPDGLKIGFHAPEAPEEPKPAFFTKQEKSIRILVIPDAHIPYHSVSAWNCILEVIRVKKPDHIVLIGDAADCLAVSSHPKSLDRKSDFAGEVDAVNTELDALQSVSGNAKISWCEGNHEDRITRYLQSNARELGGLSGLRAKNLFKCDERGIHWYPYRTFLKIGNVTFTHDVGRCGVNAARQSLMDTGTNLVFGHSHRGGVVYQGEAKGASHFCMNVGWCGDVEAIDYQHKIRAIRDWQTGFGIVDQDDQGFSWAQFVPIVEGRCSVDGAIIRG